MSRSPLSRLALLLIPALVGACGVGAVQETTFVYGAMGAEGGTVATEEVTLDIPPGALTGPTTIGILPEVNPLPIAPPAQDPCTYAILGPQYCCGPVGLDLLEDGRLAVRYDETLLPPDTTEDDLVLLLWDEGLGALVPAGQAAVHDAATDTFVVDAYAELGHLAVGYSTCPRPGIVFLGFNPTTAPLPGKQGDAPTTANEPSGLWLVSADGTLVATQVPTDDLVPQSFLPSPDGRTVLYEFAEFQTGLSPVLYSVPVVDGVPTLLAGDDEQLDTFGPTLGWMRDGSRVFFQERVVPPPALEAVTGNVTSFSTVPGDGSAAPSSLYPVGSFTYFDDVRQSQDGSLVMVAYYGGDEEQLVDVFDSATGAPASQGLIPYGGGHSSPRFLPDSSGLYLVDFDGEGVDRYDPDGTNAARLFTPPAAHGFLRDFVLAPNGDDYAYIAVDFSTQVPVDVLYVGSLSGGLRTSVDLGANSFYEEFFFHPNGQHVFLDTYDTDVQMFAASDGIAGPSLGIQGMEGLDISADDGRLLLAVWDSQRISAVRGEGSNQGQLAPGLYVADPDGQNQQLVTTPADLEVRAARWLRTVRRAPCMGGSSCFR